MRNLIFLFWRDSMIRIMICGVNGVMGRIVEQTVNASDDAKVVAGVDAFPESAEHPFPVYKTPAECKEAVDIVIDFSRPAALPGILDFCCKRGGRCRSGYQRLHQGR